MKVEDAMTYLDQVKARFHGQGSIYCNFLEVMRQFKAQEIDTDTVIQRVNELFKDHHDLITGFNTFIPTNYRIEPTSGGGNASSLLHHSDSPVPAESGSHQSYDRAFNYVNKVKQRFLAAPKIYKQFLEILQWYQKEQKQNDEAKKRYAEQKVCRDVAQLFDGHNDLLQEFEEFLPDTNSMLEPLSRRGSCLKRNGMENRPAEMKKMKRTHPEASSKPVPSPKKLRTAPTDTSVADLNQLSREIPISLLHNIETALLHSGSRKAWNQFLQHVNMFNAQQLSLQAFLEALRHLLSPCPELYHQLRELFAYPRYLDDDRELAAVSGCIAENLQQRRQDLSQMAAVGTSYRYRPIEETTSECTGRLKDKIAQEVLNDIYVVYNSLTSEDSQFISSKKNQYEESMYRVEDERYEVDMVMKLNESAIQNLEAVKRKLDDMSREEAQNYSIGENLGGSSAILMRKAIHRVYGDKAVEVIYGLKNSPRSVVPILIDRMRQKNSEWRESVRNFQRIWSEQDSKNYPRSLDHQGLSFKPKDLPAIKCKVFINQIESIANHALSRPCRMDSDPVSSLIAGSIQIPQRRLGAVATSTSVDPCGGILHSWNAEHIGSTNFHAIEGTGRDGGPHLTLQFPECNCFSSLMEDATSLIIYHVKRQSNTTKEDKRSMKLLMRTVVQDLFQCDRIPMSDDDEEESEYQSETKNTAPEPEDDDEEEDEECEEDEMEDEEEIASNESGTEDGRKKSLMASTEQEPDKQEEKKEPGSKCVPKKRRRRRKMLGSNLSIKKKDELEKGTDSSEGNKSRGAISMASSFMAPVTKAESQDMYEGPVSFQPTAQELAEMESAQVAKLPSEESFTVFYTNNQWYGLLRLIHLLVTRLNLLKSRGDILTAEHKQHVGNQNAQAAVVLKLRRANALEPHKYYKRALHLVRELLDGAEEIQVYEDRLRDMFGIYAFPWFTIDRLIANVVRQLHSVACLDEMSQKATSLFRQWNNFEKP
ncbi:Paired amphipathic helix protein Sin3b, partial [Cichlidogyrus casuarinus]